MRRLLAPLLLLAFVGASAVDYAYRGCQLRSIVERVLHQGNRRCYQDVELPPFDFGILPEDRYWRPAYARQWAAYREGERSASEGGGDTLRFLFYSTGSMPNWNHDFPPPPSIDSTLLAAISRRPIRIDGYEEHLAERGKDRRYLLRFGYSYWQGYTRALLRRLDDENGSVIASGLMERRGHPGRRWAPHNRDSVDERIKPLLDVLPEARLYLTGATYVADIADDGRVLNDSIDVSASCRPRGSSWLDSVPPSLALDQAWRQIMQMYEYGPLPDAWRGRGVVRHVELSRSYWGSGPRYDSLMTVLHCP